MKNKRYTLHELMGVTQAMERYGVTRDQINNRLKPSKVGLEQLAEWETSGLIKSLGKNWILSPDWMNMHFGDSKNK